MYFSDGGGEHHATDPIEIKIPNSPIEKIFSQNQFDPVINTV
jgi:hypothetical protein